MAKISFKISLSPKISQEVLANNVNFGPHFERPKPYYQVEYYTESENPIIDDKTREEYRFNLPTIIDDEFDEILDITEVTFFRNGN